MPYLCPELRILRSKSCRSICLSENVTLPLALPNLGVLTSGRVYPRDGWASMARLSCVIE